jgi:hypothetical protein
MDKIAWSALPLLDLSGGRANLLSMCRDKILMIFLRHLA